MHRAFARILAALVLGGWLLPPAAPVGHAAEMPVIGVSFELKARRFQSEFTPAQLPEMEKAVAARLTKILATAPDFPKLQFLRFQPAPAATETQLKIVLDEGLDSTDANHIETVLKLNLSGPEMESTEHSQVRFRAKENYSNTPIVSGNQGLDGFVDELRRALQKEEKTLRELFRVVPVARNEGVLIEGPRWLLPFKDNESCMSKGSLLIVQNELPDGAVFLTLNINVKATGVYANPVAPYEKFKGCIATYPLENQPDLRHLTRVPPSKVRVAAIYVLEYRAKGACPTPVSPRDVLVRK